MAEQMTLTANKRGRPVTTGTGKVVGVRMLDQSVAAVDAWISQQKVPGLSRPEAIRRLVELGLGLTLTATPTERLRRARRSASAGMLAKPDRSTAIKKSGDPGVSSGKVSRARRVSEHHEADKGSQSSASALDSSHSSGTVIGPVAKSC